MSAFHAVVIKLGLVKLRAIQAVPRQDIKLKAPAVSGFAYLVFYKVLGMGYWVLGKSFFTSQSPITSHQSPINQRRSVLNLVERQHLLL
ncbi:MAG TPA: hypothetical protein VK203_01920 [Nostocaceae cyanobacterium]|nr:hypothetical protein [Nostocaceae cyanobacterium]